MNEQGYRPHRSLFWPILLIGIGVLWLFSSLGTIAAINYPYLFRLWPLLLVFIGLDILVGRRSHIIGAALGVIAVAILIAIVVFGPTLGLERNVQIKTDHFTAPIAEAKQASVLLVFSDSPVSVDALPDSTDLIDAKITYIGSMIFRASGTVKKSIRLARNEADFLLFNPIYWDPSLNWQIGLTPRIPIDLNVDGGSGDSRLDLSKLNLSSLKVAMGSGASSFTVPVSVSAPLIQARGGSGGMNWLIPEGAAVELNLDGGSGGIDIHLPSAPAVRLEVRSSGSGGVSFPTGWMQIVSGRGDQGTWETPNYAQAAHKIHIVINHVGSGNIHIG